MTIPIANKTIFFIIFIFNAVANYSLFTLHYLIVACFSVLVDVETFFLNALADT